MEANINWARIRTLVQSFLEKRRAEPQVELTGQIFDDIYYEAVEKMDEEDKITFKPGMEIDTGGPIDVGGE